MRRYSRFFAIAALFVVLMHFLSQGFGEIPALGHFFSFSQGIFKNASQATYEDSSLQLNGLRDRVSVLYDKNGVPHIFAENEPDLYFAQGYITAKHRLWQMDISTRAAAGKLSEILGERSKEVDEFFLKIGLKSSSQNGFKLAQQNPEIMDIITNYTKGVNAFIEGLSYGSWPVEYKVIQAKPEKFTDERVIQLLKIMSFNLSARSYDLALTEIVRKLGWERATDLFPDFYSTEFGESGFDRLFHQPEGETSNQKTKNYRPYKTKFTNFPDFLLPFHTDGSNSWLLSSSASESGFNILANDTHLGLRAPHVWFEVRLYVPGEVNVYGVSFPGAPLVTLGFNPQLSWGATNGTIDVLDWFEVEFKDENSTEYLLDGAWKKALVSEEVLRIRGKSDETVQLLWTEFGPVVHRDKNLGLTLRWTTHESSNEIEAFYALNKARSVGEALEALRNYVTPIQNFSLADKNEISIVTAGIYPKRSYGEGRVVGDGRFSKNNWKGFANAFHHLSGRLSNRQERFLFSANQRPMGSDFEHYLGWDFAEPLRAQRIGDLLSGEEKHSVFQMMKMQNESFNQLAHLFFSMVDRDEVWKRLHGKDHDRFSSLAKWDLTDDPSKEASTLFYAWFSGLEKNLWEKEFSFQRKSYLPKRSRTLIELKKTKAEDEKKFYENLAEVFVQSLIDLKNENPDLSDWSWGSFRPTEFKHITSFPGFEVPSIRAAGSFFSLNANRGNHAGTWRLVAEMSDPIKAWSQTPGSTEGNPLSPHYADNILEWSKGEFRSVPFLPEHELKDQSRAFIELRPK